MINVPLTRAEALLMIELLNRSHDSLTQALLNAVEEENNHDEVVRAAKQNYVANLESEVGRLSKEVDQIKKPKQPAGLTEKEKALAERLGLLDLDKDRKSTRLNSSH